MARAVQAHVSKGGGGVWCCSVEDRYSAKFRSCGANPVVFNLAGGVALCLREFATDMEKRRRHRA